MANFETGIKAYIKATAVVETFFPIDFKGNAEIACKHCNYYVRATQRCGLTQMIVNYPDKYVGECCPLEPIETTEEFENV